MHAQSFLGVFLSSFLFVCIILLLSPLVHAVKKMIKLINTIKLKRVSIMQSAYKVEVEDLTY